MFRPTKSKSENNERLTQACSTASSALQTTLRIVKEVVGEAAVPGLKAGVSGLLAVLEGIKKTSQNAEDIEGLSTQIEDLNLSLENFRNGRTLSPLAIDRINRLFNTSNAMLEELQKMASRSAIKRFMRSDDDAHSINSHIQMITLSLQTFMAATTLSIESLNDEHAFRLEEKIDNLCEITRIELQKMNARLDTKDEHSPHATYAPFNFKGVGRCLEGTRTDILDQIFRWIGVGDLQSQSGHVLNREGNAATTNTRIFWINGSAGTGKTTIAYTVAEDCRNNGVLGASFFCSRDDADCSNPKLIFASIAYQLGTFNALFKAEVTRVVNSNPDIGYTDPAYQLQELIIKPLRTLGSSFSPCVIVLDALDECTETGATSVILSSLARHVNDLFPLKFLVTSRPERHITAVFKSSKLNPATRRFILHEVELGVVQSDIKHYLSTKLAFTRESLDLENEWPPAADIDTLTRISFGLFVFASTSVRFIEDRNYCDPKGQLARLLCNAPTATEDSSPHYRLDQLYAQVLKRAFPKVSAHLSGQLKIILGSIVLLRDPLSPVALERLLGLPSRRVGVTLQHLHSVIMVPDDHTQVIRTLHPSFFDFITNSTRCLNPEYVVDPQEQHTLLARACLDAMKHLKRDICGIQNPSLLNSEVDDLSTRVETRIPPELQYACRHWAWHLENATFSDILVHLLNEFCSKYLLYWVEALSLIGDLRNGLLALDGAQKTIARADRGMTDAKDLLRDCERFTREFFWIISSSSLQIYHSGLLFTPEKTSMKKIYGRELDLPVKICNGLDETWGSCLRTIEGHFGRVESVAFSPDGTRIVSGSYDKTVRLWDIVSGQQLLTLEGHFERVESVTFSPDGTRIVSGSHDTTVRLWNAVSGAHLNTLEGHSESVQSVAFSPDGTRIVSGSHDHTLRLWEAASGAHLNTLEGHSHWVQSVSFSPDSTRIVSGSSDCTIRLWDAVTGAPLITLEGHSDWVESVSFSPNGTRIVSGSRDNTVRIWDSVTGGPPKIFKESSDWVQSVAFSSDGKRIVSGSHDNTVQLWNADSGSHLKTLKGHSGRVQSVAFSSDGTCIVSGSSDHTIRLWDAVYCAHLETQDEYSDRVQSVAFSPDGTRVVSGSRNETVRLWDAASGAKLKTFKGHSDWVRSVAFSLDGTRIASGSDDNTVRLWDAVSGAHLKPFEGHSHYVQLVVISPDGTRIMSRSSDRTIRLWDAISGAYLNTLKGYSHQVQSLAFSPDSTRIVNGSLDCTVRLWEAFSGGHLNTYKGHSNWVESVAFSPDGTRIVSGSLDKTVRLWDAVSGAHLNTLEGHSNSVRSVTFTPDGARIVSGSLDKTVRLWDAVSGAHLETITGHFSSLESVVRSYTLCQSPITDTPNTTGPVFGYIANDGWVHSFTRNRRIVWIPFSCRPCSQAARGDRVVFGTGDGRVIILDFEDMDSYFLPL